LPTVSTKQSLSSWTYSAQETANPGVRRQYIRRFRYAIFYAVDFEADELVVLHIRHAARQWPWLEMHTE
jgi:plasmid stabilization system protein ParE